MLNLYVFVNLFYIVKRLSKYVEFLFFLCLSIIMIMVNNMSEEIIFKINKMIENVKYIKLEKRITTIRNANN